MLRKERSFLVFIVVALTMSAYVMKSNINQKSLVKSKNSVPFNSDIFVVTINNYSKNSDHSDQKKLSESSFDRRKTYPWKDDPSCQHFAVQENFKPLGNSKGDELALPFSDILDAMAKRNSLPKWALTSFPGSGVTWTRQMIEGLTGIYTGSVHVRDPLPYREDNEENMGITDNPFCGCTLIDKDHEATSGIFERKQYLELLHVKEYSQIINVTYNYRGVLLLRNPMDVVFAHQNHLLVGKFNTAPTEAFRGPEWDELVETVAYAWANHAIRWIEQIKQGTVIFYENLLGDDAQLELERLLDSMDFQPRPVDTNRMRCTLAHKDKSEYKRSNKTRLSLETNHRVKLMKSINLVQHSLRKRNWPLLPVHLYDKHWSIGEYS